jgi:hypothetical protein
MARDHRIDRRPQFVGRLALQIADLAQRRAADQPTQGILAGALQHQVEVVGGDIVDKLVRVGDGERHQHVNGRAHVVGGWGFEHRRVVGDLAPRDQVVDDDPRRQEIAAAAERLAVLAAAQQQGASPFRDDHK